jgi:hypothetical protein
MHRATTPALVLMMLCLLASPVIVTGQTFNSGSTGADGALSPTSGTVTLTLPPSGVFNFTIINIPSSVTVRFTRNAANTPVTLLATGAVTIAGTINIGGGNGGNGVSGTSLSANNGLGGPGGFDGGTGSNGIAATVGGAGLGPGGGLGTGTGSGGGGGFGSVGGNGTQSGIGGAVYGTETLLPLIGGSGGAGGGASFGNSAGGGAGGGGAILIASSGTITFTGSIIATGGNGGSGGGGSSPGAGGGGSGGAIRLAASAITGTNGFLDVRGGNAGSVSGGSGGGGGVGRIRIEAVSNTAVVNANTVPPSVGQPSVVALSSGPGLAITSVGGISAPASPAASFAAPDITLPAGTTNPVAVTIAGANIPAGTAVTLTVSGQTGGSTSTTATLSGTTASTTASASVTIPTNRPSVLMATATFTLTSDAGGGPVYADGELIEHVRVTAAWGGPSQVT